MQATTAGMNGVRPHGARELRMPVLLERGVIPCRLTGSALNFNLIGAHGT